MAAFLRPTGLLGRRRSVALFVGRACALVIALGLAHDAALATYAAKRTITLRSTMCVKWERKRKCSFIDLITRKASRPSGRPTCTAQSAYLDAGPVLEGALLAHEIAPERASGQAGESSAHKAPGRASLILTLGEVLALRSCETDLRAGTDRDTKKNCRFSLVPPL